LVTLNEMQVPPDEWQFLALPDARRTPLEEASFAEIAAKIAKEASLASEPRAEMAEDRAAPPNALRAVFPVAVTPSTGDLMHNARDGLRGRYWLSPDEGNKATRHLVELLKARLLQALPRDGLNIGKLVLSCDAVARALDLPSTKVWVDEEQRQSDGQSLEVARWALNETEANNPRLWRWTPQASIVEVKTAWVETDGTEWVSDGKKERRSKSIGGDIPKTNRRQRQL
jgi:hypothetical protein